MAFPKQFFGRLRARKAQIALAFRMTVGAAAAFAIANAFHLLLPLWAVLTSMIVTQQSVGRSLKTTRDYMFGTIGGALYGGAIAVLIPHNGELQLLAMLVLAIAPVAFIAAINPSFNTATVTSVIVLLVPAMSHVNPIGSAIDRVCEVAVGALTGLAVSSLLVPARAHVQIRAAAGRVLELIAAALAELLAGLSRGRDTDALHRIQDGIGTALTDLNTIGAEAERERSARLSSGADTGPLLRTILRLRHDVVIIGRASVVPLPSELQARLAGPVARVSEALTGYLRGCGAALRAASAPPPIWPVHVAVKAFAGEIASVRTEGLTRGLPSDAAERFFALSFSLEQMRQNLIDMERVVAEWSEAPAGKESPRAQESTDTAGA